MGFPVSRYLLKYRLTPVCYYFLRLYLSLLRVNILFEGDAHYHFKQSGRIVVALWHQRLLPTLAYVVKFRSLKPIVMISQSRDGELIANIAQRLGLVPVRGSSSRGGRSAMSAILEGLRDNPAVVHIVDGPTGPKGVIKPGLIYMAQFSSAVILPLIVSADRAWILRSWDRFLVPKPFSTVTIKWGKPFFVPRELDRETFESYRKTIEDKMKSAYAEADIESGWSTPL